MRLQRNCRKQAIAVRREKALVHSGKKTRPEAGSPHPMAIGAAAEAAGLESDGFLEQGTGDSDFQIVWVIM